jgi:negative regulator of flagellin synthesis FlgM
MDIHNGVDGLKILLGVPSAEPAQPQTSKNSPPASTGAFAGDRATLSNAGSEILETSAEAGVRMAKVAAVQKAIAAGTYSVPATAVAEKIVEAMLVVGQTTGN